MIDGEYKALKEWAITIKALDEGRQIVLLRKGGIHEENREFSIKYKRFLLYPTYEHQREDLIKEEFRGDLRILQDTYDKNKVTIQNWAMISDVVLINESEKLEALLPYHIWTADYAHKRLNWRPKRPLHLLFLRVFRLSKPRTIDVLPEHRGCKSWIDLQCNDFSFERENPVLKDEEFKYISEEIKDLALKG